MCRCSISDLYERLRENHIDKIDAANPIDAVRDRVFQSRFVRNCSIIIIITKSW